MKRFACLAAALIAGAFVFIGCGSGSRKQVQVADPTGVEEYRAEAKRAAEETEYNTGSLWTNSGQNSNLFRDMKARFVNDVVTIRVSETTQAVSSADASSRRASSMSAGIEQLAGLENGVKELPGLLSGAGQIRYNGQGATTRATQLQTMLTARVIDVLPNGYLVVEGKREVRVNNENQIVILSGVVRPNDISRSNVVLSSAVAQMSVQVQGKGTVSQPLKPGWLHQIINGIWPL
ncbi:MAG: flagellar basal body L-ring protein FlgH [Acidobacteriota bacterium]|jgi:flagellar L-ring protein precursor FlgH|nr:flagellar basal body L-ring protein FlgH [Acidobacteriota bacterium]